MKKFLFISDFDGTISKEDFYKKIMKKYMPEKENTTYKQFKAQKILDIDFLNDIFNNMNICEETLEKEILGLDIDERFFDAINMIKYMGGDVIILSAGCEYYIEKILKKHGLSDIPIYSNKGICKDNGLYITPDKSSTFYSERYGIDKELVVKYFTNRYSFVIYAGDSDPDYQASLQADVRFGKDELMDIYNENSIEYIPMADFGDVVKYLNDIQFCLTGKCL